MTTENGEDDDDDPTSCRRDQSYQKPSVGERSSSATQSLLLVQGTGDGDGVGDDHHEDEESAAADDELQNLLRGLPTNQNSNSNYGSSTPNTLSFESRWPLLSSRGVRVITPVLLLALFVIGMITVFAAGTRQAMNRRSTSSYTSSKEKALVLQRRPNTKPQGSAATKRGVSGSPAAGVGAGRTISCTTDSNGKPLVSLHLQSEFPLTSLLRHKQGQDRFEASSIITINDTFAYVVCDNSWSIAQFTVSSLVDPQNVSLSSTVHHEHTTNVLIGDPNREEEDSGYEALVYDDISSNLYVIRESIQVVVPPQSHQSPSYRAIVQQVAISTTTRDYSVLETCMSEMEFDGDSKGLEGVIAIRDLQNRLVLLGLCEGNDCSESKKAEPGNGRLVVLRKTIDPKYGTCVWSKIRIIPIPSSAYFEDYSDISLDPHQPGRVAIASQRNSQVWIGTLLGQQPNGLWDIHALKFDDSSDVVYDFPLDEHCNIVYCSIEGIQWLKSNQLLAVSDKAKSTQDPRCVTTEQSVHLFTIPQ